MFRLFLVNLLQSGHELEEADSLNKTKKSPQKRLRNRRIFDRFDIDHKHLSLMNDQDILLIRDLSSTGFSTEVSERGYQRLKVGDVYRCRIRYLGEIYDSEACVRWKAKNFVGFEVIKASQNVKQFMKRLMKPIEVGTSLQKVDEKFIKNRDNEGMDWYHGANESNFYLWLDDEGELKSWHFEEKQRFIKWDPTSGISTGIIQEPDRKKDIYSNPWQHELLNDKKPNLEFKQFATDVFMALQNPAKDKLIESILAKGNTT